MKNIFNNFLIQGWMLDPLEVMEKDEQDEYKLALINTAIAGKVQTDNPKWKRLLEKALSSIQETRTKYYEKSQKNGMKGKEFGIQGKEFGIQGKEFGIQGKEFGIQGKEFGKLGGRPRKGETKDEYNERKRLENESLVSEEKGEDSK